LELMGSTLRQQGGNNRNIVHHGLATGRGRSNDYVLSGEDFRDPFSLMGIEGRNGCGLEDIHHHGGQMTEVRDTPCWARRDGSMVHNGTTEHVMFEKVKVSGDGGRLGQ